MEEGVGERSKRERGEWKFGTAKEAAAGKKGARRMSEGVEAGGRKDRRGGRDMCAGPLVGEMVWKSS